MHTFFFFTRFVALLLAITATLTSSFSPLPVATTTTTTVKQSFTRQQPQGGRWTPRLHASTQPWEMMPATIEREAVQVGGPSVLERPETERRITDDPSKERKGMGHEAWEVRIYNDGMNTREHVARSLVQVTGMSEMAAYQTMMQAHQNGIAVVGRWVYEVAEMYYDALRKQGIICDIVPVEEE